MKFSELSDDALRGFILMQQDFLSGSMYEDPLRSASNTRLEKAINELASREAIQKQQTR